MGAINPHYDLRYVETINPNLIWRWWFTEQEPGFIERQNKEYDNLFDRMEKSIRKEGFKNPLIITCGGGNTGDIFRMIHENIEKDPHKLEIFDRFKNKEELLSTQLFATKEGDGRIYMAKKLKINIRAVILDYSGTYRDHREIANTAEFLRLFDPVYAAHVSNLRFTDTSISFDLDPWVKMYFKPFSEMMEENKKEKRDYTKMVQKKTLRMSDLFKMTGRGR